MGLSGSYRSELEVPTEHRQKKSFRLFMGNFNIQRVEGSAQKGLSAIAQVQHDQLAVYCFLCIPHLAITNKQD